MTRLVLLLVAFACCAVAAPAAAGPCEDLAQRIAAAPKGGVVTIGLGLRSCDVVVRGPLTLRGQPQSAVRSLTVTGTDVVVDGLRVVFTPEMDTVSHTPALRVTGAKRVVLRNVEVLGGPAIATLSPGDAIAGQPTGRGITVERSEDIRIERCRVRTFHKGIVIYLTARVVVRGCDVGDVRTTALSGSALTGPVLIEANYLHDSNPLNYGAQGDHGDFLHLWTDPRVHDQATTDVTIRGNLMDAGDGYPIMGLYLDDNDNRLGFRDVVIVDNVVLSAHGQGILLENVHGRVDRNILLQSSGFDWRKAPSVRLKDSKVSASGNRSADVYGHLAAFPGNLTVPRGPRPEPELNEARAGWRRIRDGILGAVSLLSEANPPPASPGVVRPLGHLEP